MTNKVKTENDIEITDSNVSGNDNSDGAVEKGTEPTSFSTKIKNFINIITVEPFLLVYIFFIALSSTTIQKLNMEKACRADLNYSENVCYKAISGNLDEKTALNELQKVVAEMSSWQQPLQNATPALLTLFLGAWSDRTGNRKFLMLFPMFGELVSAIGLLLTTYFFLEWPLWVTAIIQALPAAIMGNISIFLMGTFSYVADITTPESRTFRMGCVGVIANLAIPLGLSISGVLTKFIGYYGIFGLSSFGYAFGLIYGYFRIHDVRRVKTEGTVVERIREFLNPKNPWDTITLLFLLPKKKLVQLWLLIWAHIVHIGPVSGEGALRQMHALNQFSIDELEFGLFSTCNTLVEIAGTTVAIAVFSKIMKMRDELLGIITSTSKTLAHFTYGLAPTKLWFYAGVIVEFFGNCGSTVVRSLSTQVVNPDEVGKVCSLIGLVEAVVPIVYTPIFSKLYANTNDTLPGAIYLLGGTMSIPAIFIFIILYFMYKKQASDVVKDPYAKEMHAHENAVTVL